MIRLGLGLGLGLWLGLGLPAWALGVEIFKAAPLTKTLIRISDAVESADLHPHPIVFPSPA